MAKKPSALMWYVILLLSVSILALAIPPNPATLHTFHITASVYRFLMLTLLVPFALIWFSAFYAYDKLEQYAQKLRATREETAFKRIADGLRILAWGLVIPTIISLVLTGFANHYTDFRPTATIINNYLALLVPIVSFIIIGNGTRILTDIARVRPSLMGTRMFVIAFTILGVIYTHLVLRNRFTNQNPYYLPTTALMLTIIVPYLIAWFIGLLAAYELQSYSQKVKGLLYRQALRQLAGGLLVVILASIGVQYLNGITTTKGDASLGVLLAVVYVLLFVEAAGFALIALGAKRLKRIEEV